MKEIYKVIAGVMLGWLSLFYGVANVPAFAADFQLTKESNLQISAPGHLSVTGEVIEVMGRTFAVLTDFTNAPLLYVLDQPAGKATVVSAEFNTPKYLTYLRGYLFFNATGSTGDVELWRVNCSTLESMKINLYPSASSQPSQLFVFQGDLYFTADHATFGRELWRLGASLDGSDANVVVDITLAGSSVLGDFLVGGKYFYFVGPGPIASKTRLWASDGTAINTHIVQGQVQDGDFDSDSSKPFLVDGVTHFYRHRYITGDSITKLYSVDDSGAQASAQYVGEMMSGNQEAYDALPSGEDLYFLWSPSQKLLYYYDITGTTETQLDTDVSEWLLIHDVLYFVAGGELFKAREDNVEAVSPGVQVSSLSKAQGLVYMLKDSGELLYTAPHMNVASPVDTAGVSDLSNVQGKTEKLYFAASVDDYADLYSVKLAAHENVQVRYEDCGDLEAPLVQADNALFIAHGWHDDVGGWAMNMADNICSELGAIPTPATEAYFNTDTVAIHCHGADWDVFLIDWRSKSSFSDGVEIQRQVYRNAAGRGKQIGQCIVQKAYDHVHLMAQGSGANLIEQIKERLLEADPQPVIHMTFFDAYDPYAQLGTTYSNGSYSMEQMLISDYGSGANWIDNYLDIRTLENGLVDWFDRRRTFLASGFNLDVTRYDVDMFNSSQGEHSWPYSFYGEHTINPVTPDATQYDVGFQLSKLAAGTFPPLNRPAGKGCKLPENSGDDFLSSCNALFTVDPFLEEEPLKAVPTSGSDSWISATRKSVNGEIVFHNPGKSWSGASYLKLSNDIGTPVGVHSSVLPQGIPVWVSFDLQTIEVIDTLEFNYEFMQSAGGEGLLTVFVDGYEVIQLDERYHDSGLTKGSNVYNSGKLFIESLAPGAHTISLRMDQYGGSDSTVYITDLKIGKIMQEEEQYVFPWPAFMPAIIGGKNTNTE